MEEEEWILGRPPAVSATGYLESNFVISRTIMQKECMEITQAVDMRRKGRYYPITKSNNCLTQEGFVYFLLSGGPISWHNQTKTCKLTQINYVQSWQLVNLAEEANVRTELE